LGSGSFWFFNGIFSLLLRSFFSFFQFVLGIGFLPDCYCISVGVHFLCHIVVICLWMNDSVGFCCRSEFFFVRDMV